VQVLGGGMVFASSINIYLVRSGLSWVFPQSFVTRVVEVSPCVDALGFKMRMHVFFITSRLREFEDMFVLHST